ncbi:DUF2971 domain-containing protein [Streptococcus salivarius]|uniref:DUF2971 domain-containing protein n=1 Tax=Streptococcus salivarius TaxID=1304 RepID=UPI00093890AA|nr:DUF2971 domain-containing protein [Streptococcus salivarius]
MDTRLFFWEKDSSKENFEYDGGNAPTFCFFPKKTNGVEDKNITLDIYYYYRSNGIRMNQLIGGIKLFFINETDYNELSSRKYQKLSDFDKTGLVYSFGTSVYYYYFLNNNVKYKTLADKLGDIVLFKKNLTQFKEKLGETEFSSISMGIISEYLMEVSQLVFEFTDKEDYLDIPKSENLYANEEFAKKYTKLYEKYFDRMNSSAATILFLYFIYACINKDKEKYLKYKDIVKKIKTKYDKSPTIQKEILKLNEGVDKALEKIKKIKDFLSVKEDFLKEKNIHLGHYTSIATLRILLENQNKEISGNDEITNNSTNTNDTDDLNQNSCLRLTNSRLMNDPLEGKVITRYLDDTYEQEAFLPSSIYMMCVTPNVDILPMWQQYGDNGAGAFIRLDNEYLNSIISSSEADIYRVCYLDSEGKVHVSHMDEEDETELKNDLEELRKLCEELKNTRSDMYPEIISSIQQDISFLFKTIDYSYEEEYRIVVSNTDQFKYEIKCEKNKDYPFPFLYIYLNVLYSGSKYNEVIIGPKAIDIDFLGPYINYLDPNIDIKSSKIPYR